MNVAAGLIRLSKKPTLMIVPFKRSLGDIEGEGRYFNIEKASYTVINQVYNLAYSIKGLQLLESILNF